MSVHENAVELDRTVFYPLGGGQAGDTGRIGGWRVLDTRNSANSVLHLLEPGAKPSPGEKLEVRIDWERRYRLMRLHTALHLLSVRERRRVLQQSHSSRLGRRPQSFIEGGQRQPRPLREFQVCRIVGGKPVPFRRFKYSNPEVRR